MDVAIAGNSDAVPQCSGISATKLRSDDCSGKFKQEADMESLGSEGEMDEKDGGKDSGKDGLGVKVKRKSRRGRSTGSLTMKGDKITSFTTERGVTYAPGDHVYIENNRQNQPYFICSIVDFSVMKRDTLMVKVKWYYRVSEVPDSVYQHLIQDRYTQHVEKDHPLADPRVKARELFCSEATDTYPVTALRGKCKVVHCNSLEAARTFRPAPETFYCILGYNPETKRLATTQGQIRVGSMYQARMPECKPNVPPLEMPERCEEKEEFRWQPRSVHDGDLMMYLRAARSVAAFAGMCDGGSTEDGCQAASMDDTTINAMHMLHNFEYDTGRALQALVKAPALRTIDKKWNEEDTKRFVKGLRVYGKNFFKIRKELLSHRETGELVEYYYFWKKTPAAAANRPHRRHRRHGVKRATTRSQRPASSEFLDLSSGSDSDDSEDSDGLSGFRCQNCLVTVSKDWSHAGKPSQQLLCSKCRIFFKKYGVDRPLENTGDSPYFQPVKDGDLNGCHSMLTRQARNSTDSKDNKKKGTNSVSSLDNLDSPSSDSKKSLVPSSPSALSTCSNSSTDREKKRRGSESPGKEKKRHRSGSQDKFSKRKREGQSDSESVSDSSISGAEETPNDGDIETNQEELSSSSPPSSPSPVESDFNKHDKSTPVPIPSDSSDIAGKLADLPRPQPQHPSPNRPPIESTPLNPSPLSPSGSLKNSLTPGGIPQLPQQAFVPLPPLPAFAFRPKLNDPYPPHSHSPYSDTLNYKSSPQVPTSTETSSSSVPCSSPYQPDKVYNRAESADRSDGESREGSSVIAVQPKIKEEAVTPPPSPPSVYIKTEPQDSGFMSKQNQNGPGSMVQESAYASKDMFGAPHKEPFELVTPKIEPGLMSPNINIGTKVLPVANSVPLAAVDNVNKDRSDLSLTLPAEVKCQGTVQGQGVVPDAQEGDRPEVEIMEDSDSDREGGTTTPGPTPTPCNKEIHRSKSAIFMKLLNRGENNSCSRCDLIFKPLHDSKLARKRAEREKKGVTSTMPAKEEPAKRKTETPPPNSSADAQVVSSIPPQVQHSHQDRVTPRSYQDTPALRQLSEYAKPHAVGQDPRSMPGYLGFSPFMDPIRMAAMYPPNSRERLELELERDKRERDAREREIREQELRSMEMREKLKAELEMKPPGLERLLPPGASPLDPHWLEIQRRYGPHMLPGPGSSPHGGAIPGIYPPTSIASDLMVRERERLERLGIPAGHPMLAESSYAAIMERLSAERISAERMSAERLSAERLQAERQAALQDPMFRLQMSAAAAQHAHQHTHAHSHTHLHLHQPDLIPPPGPPAGPSGMPHPLLQHPLLHDSLHSEQNLMTSRMIYQIYTQRLTQEQHVYMQRVSNELIMRAGNMGSLPGGGAGAALSKHDPRHLVDPASSHLVYQFSRADPMSGVNGAGSNQTPPVSMVGMPPHLLSREQELLQNDLYRRAYADPALAQQLQHEALQRMVLDRERFGSGHLPPPH